MAGRKRNEPTTEEAPEPTVGPSAPSGVSGNNDQTPPEVAPPSDDTDVPAAIDTEISDGPGDDPVPPSDFESFATEGVHRETKQVGEVASEVLQGLWGDFSVSRERLDNAGHDASAVLTKVNERLTRGAPSAHRATPDQVAEQIIRGEWGDSVKALDSRLLGAGYKAADVAEILRSARNI